MGKVDNAKERMGGGEEGRGLYKNHINGGSDDDDDDDLYFTYIQTYISPTDMTNMIR